MPSNDTELERTREENAALRATMSGQEHSLHCAAREREFRRRIEFLEQARMCSADSACTDPFDSLLDTVISAVKGVHEQGFAIVPAALTTLQVEQLRESLEPFFRIIREHFRAKGGAGGQTFHVHNVLAKTRSVDFIATLPLLRACIAGILGPDALLHGGAVVMSPDPGCDPQGIHRDDASFAALPRPRMPLVVTAAFALDDYTRQNGATHVAAGSCWWERERRPAREEMQQCEMPAGSLLLWDGAIFHAGGANITPAQSRRTVTFNYTRGWLRTQSNQFLSVPRGLVLSLSPELQRDLGYEPSARGLGTVDELHPLEYLRIVVERGGDGIQAVLGPEVRDT